MPEPCPMFQIEQRLGDSLEWNLARVKFLARFLVALFAVKTVCLTQIASAFPGTAKTDSHYKRLQRFLRSFDLDEVCLARLIAGLVCSEPPWVLAIDRTNWKLGKTEINFLVLALVHNGVAFPLFWHSLGRAGNSTSDQRIALLTRFVTTFGAAQAAFVCADREFASTKWLDWLCKHQISFRLRLKSDTLVANGRGEMVCAAWLFRDCVSQQERLLCRRRVCLGQRLWVAGTRLAVGDFLIIVSDCQAPLSDYALRWGIETLFGALKSRGYCLEATHLVAEERLSKLLALLAIAFCWAFSAGVWLAAQKPLRLKKHGRPAISLFRSGLDWLRRLLLPLCGQFRQGDWQQALQFLSCT